MAGNVKTKQILTTEERVNRETRRLKRIYAGLGDDEKKVVEGLIVQAARLRVSLDDLWDDLQKNGETELFTQSEKTEPYERKRPQAELFNSRDKNYQTLVKLLCDRLPEKPKEDPAEELLKFTAGIDR